MIALYYDLCIFFYPPLFAAVGIPVSLPLSLVKSQRSTDANGGERGLPILTALLQF